MRQNNFDILRLMCALLVMVSHSWDLAGCAGDEPLLRLSGGRLVCSAIGLCGFFTISGYLIYNSLMNSRSVGNYIQKRWLRIFPGLIVCLLVTLCVCSLFYEGDGYYWLKSGTWNYLWRNMTLYDLQYEIPGVFEQNPYGAGVNGSLWTLCYEFTMYILIIPLFFIRNDRSKLALAGVAMILVLMKNVLFAEKFVHADFMYYMNLNQFCRFAQFFITGMMVAMLERVDWLKKGWIENRWSLWTLLAVCIALLGVNQIALGMLAMSVLFIQLGKHCWAPIVNVIGKVGDLSYGIYIYGFVVQQSLLCALRPIQPNTIPCILLIMSVFGSVLVAYASWHLVEKKALKFKNKM